MKKVLKIIIILIFLILISMVVIKSVTNEDDWICENGKWVKHGFPSSEKPLEPCEDNFIQKIFEGE